MTVEQAKVMIEFQTKMAISSGEKIEQLEKEHEELKLQLKVAGDRIDSLSRTGIDLSNQIERMKCCGNCKNIFICKKSDKSGMGSYPYNCKEWEMK